MPYIYPANQRGWDRDMYGRRPNRRWMARTMRLHSRGWAHRRRIARRNYNYVRYHWASRWN